MENTFLLTFVKEGKVSVLFSHIMPQEVQREKKKRISNPQYRGGEFQIRTLLGFKSKPIL
jgi:hypothetical protein